jgi:hypothetical protein
MLIANYVNQCFELFKEAESNIEIYETNDPSSGVVLKEACARFNIWKNNIGAHRKGQASLDYRLRDASNLRKTVVDLLQDILSALKDVNGIVVGETVPWDKKDPTQPSNDMISTAGLRGPILMSLKLSLVKF